MRLSVVLTVAAREVREALRSRTFILAAGGFLVLSLGLSSVGLAGAERSGLAGFDRTTASLLNLALLFVPMVAILLGALSFATEMEDGALVALLVQPVSRLEVYLGKCLGGMVAVGGAILAGFGCTGVIVGVLSGGNAKAFVGLVGAMLLLSVAMLALGVFLSVALRARNRVLGVAFVAWLCCVYLSDLATIGLTVMRSLSAGQVFAVALVNPVQQARLLGVLSLTPRLDLLGPAGLFGLDAVGPRGLVVLLVATLLTLAGVWLAAGYALFRKAAVP